MGSNYCVKYCDKTEKVPSDTGEKKTLYNNNDFSLRDSIPQYNYNQFSKKFNFFIIK